MLFRSVDKILGRIDPVAHPEFAGNDPLKKTIGSVVDEIKNYTDAGGIIDAAALEGIRKNAVNNYLSTLPMDPQVRQKAAAKIVGEIKPVIDDAIEAAGGRGWRDYLNTYSRWAQEINANKLAGAAQQKIGRAHV